MIGPDSFVAGLRNVLAVRNNPLDSLSALAQQGDIVDRRLGPYPAYLLNTPDLVKELLVNGARTTPKGPLIQASKPIDLHEEMMRLTLAVVGKALFGDDFERDAGQIRRPTSGSCGSCSSTCDASYGSSAWWRR